MATFTIETPNGRRLTIEAADEAQAIAGAKQWHEQQEPLPKPPPGAIIHGPESSTVAGTGLTAQRPADPEQAAVTLEALKQRSEGRDLGSGGRALAPIAQGLSLSLGDELVSAGVGAIRAAKGGNFSNERAIAQEIQKQELARERAENPYRAAAGEIGGGLATGLGAFGAGATAARFIPAGLQGAGRFGAGLGASAADAAAYGAISGAGSGEGAADRAEKALAGGALGGALGAGIPVAGRVASLLAAPVVNPIMARVAPEGFANAKILQAFRRSGQEPQQVARELRQAAAEGQPMFAVADALGNAGQRAASSVARVPHNERQALVDFLEQRQAGQGRRVANALAEGLDAPATASQMRTALTEARDRAADRAYGAVRQDAGPVDLTRVVDRIDETLAPGLSRLVSSGDNLAADSVERTLQGVRSRLTDSNSMLTDFEAVQRVRGDLADMISKAERAGEGNKVRLLTQVRTEMDRAMEDASAGFRQANRSYAAGSRAIEAVDTGRIAAMRGRVEDTVPEFRGLTAREQQGYRAGYADPLIEQTQGAAYGVNKARPFTSDAFRAETAAIAPQATGPTMMRRIGRENTMFETRHAATGGSRTADNLADSADLQMADPAILSNLLTGNFMQAARSAGSRGMSELSGMAPPVAERVARALMETNPRAVLANVDAARRSLAQREITARLLNRALLGGTVAGIEAQ